MNDDIATGFLAGAGDSLNLLLLLILGLMLLGWMGHWWFWVIVVPIGSLAWWAVARHRKREWERFREETARQERLRQRRPSCPGATGRGGRMDKYISPTSSIFAWSGLG